MNNTCPRCNAPLQENAQFCPHCMTVLAKKEEIEKPKNIVSNKRKAVFVITAVLLAAAITFTGVFTAINIKKHSPICSVEQFKAAAVEVSNKKGLNRLWEPDGFTDTHAFKDKKLIQYNTTTYLGDSVLSVFFFNDGEEVYAYFSDIKQEKLENAKSLIKCVTQSVCNNYFTDLDEVFDNEKIYPKSPCNKPFYTEFTDLLNRTEQYNADLAGGTEISSRYIETTDNEFLIYYYVTERKTDDNILYDLALEIEKA